MTVQCSHPKGIYVSGLSFVYKKKPTKTVYSPCFLNKVYHRFSFAALALPAATTDT
jgi:hypothetical protein